MFEDYRIVEVRGEPLAADRVGVRLRIQLSGCPSGRWSRDVSARLARDLVGHAAVGHLRLNKIVQGDPIVLEGVEASEAPALADALQRAVGAANQAPAGEESSTANVAQEEADAIAAQIAPAPTGARSRTTPPATRSRPDSLVETRGHAATHEGAARP
jgi:hypothetical protein